MRVKAAVMREINKPLSIEEVELGQAKEGEVLVKISYCGFCHSDLALVTGTQPYPFPGVLGHEASGVVEDVGPGVTSLKKGDHVVGTWMTACGQCPECVKGWRYLCRRGRAIMANGTLLDGTSRLTDAYGNMLRHAGCVSGFAEYSVIPELAAIKIREDMPLDQACFFGCAMPTGFGAVINVAQVKPGDSVAIWGMGGVGLNVVQGAKLRGAYPVFGVDLEGSKESIAKEFGVTHFINNSKEDPVPIIKEMTGGGVNFSFEVIGDVGATVQAYWAMGPKGKLVQIGGHRLGGGVELPLLFLSYSCQTIEGTTYGNTSAREDIPVFVDMVMRGEYKLDKLISRRFKLDEINDVAEAISKRQVIGRWVCSFE